MNIYNYVALHLPTGKRFDKVTSEPYTRLEFLEVLNSWNRSNPGVWCYYA